MADITNSSHQKSPRFVHLRVHSTYSLLEGALKVKDIVGHALSDHEPAIAITDTNNLFGALEFTQSCLAAGVQPIIGCQLAIEGQDKDNEAYSSSTKVDKTFANVVLLAADETGYNNLVHLVSKAYLDASTDELPHLKRAWLEGLSDGIIALTGGNNGPINRALKADKEEVGRQDLAFLQKLFPNRLYVELQRHGGYDQAIERQLIDMAYQHNLPLVATNEAYFKGPASYEAHDALLAIAEGELVSNPERRRLTPDHYLKTQQQMVSLFADVPEAIENTVEIAKRCHVFTPKRDPILPRFTESGKDQDSQIEAEAAELCKQAQAGLKMRLETIGLAANYTLEDYEKRLAYELDVIIKMQFPGYFLIVSDFIKWAKAHDIPVGPGRGSGAGSLVAYALTITDVDPLRFSLLFERFLNPDRVSMPDFDIDFCQDRRDEVISYVQSKYGYEQVAQIITFGKLQARAVLRDVGRVLELPYRQVDYLTKLVPQKPGTNVELAKAIQDEPKFQEEKNKDAVIGRLLDISLQLEGLYRHASTHAAGIVIGDRPLWQLVPMYRDNRSDMPVTQFNMKYVEQAGLVKFDFLGLKTLTIIKTAIEFVKRKGIDIDIDKISLSDKPTYEMMARGETVGVFQVESAGMRKALLGMKPDRIEDIIALVALYRPGPMENIPTYNARKHKEEEIASIHPKIDYLLEETQGVIVYQEQVMEIAQVLAGYSLGEADLLRRAMGKKIHAEMEKQRERFVRGAMEREVDKIQANSIFDLLAKFADYGFNKSHAAAYAIVSYQTAYLKAHYPVEFLAASMTYDMSNLDKLNDFHHEARRLGISVIAPSVQTSYRAFEVGPNCIYYSLAAIKGVGEHAVDHIVEQRGDKPFKDLLDFCERTNPKIINKRVMESLIYAGALDCFNISRAVLFAGIEAIHARSVRSFENEASGQVDFFSQGNGPQEPLLLPQVEPWLDDKQLHKEFQTIGFYLSAHPLDSYTKLLERLRVQNWANFSKAVKLGAVTAGRLAGTLSSKQYRKTRSGKRMAIVQFSDSTGQFEAVLFNEVLNQYDEILEPGQSFILMIGAENRPEGVNLRINGVSHIDKEAARVQKAMRIYIRQGDVVERIKQQLKQPGDGKVSFIILSSTANREIEIEIPSRYAINQPVASAIKAINGVVEVELL